MMSKCIRDTSKYEFTVRMHLSPTSKLGYLSFKIAVSHCARVPNIPTLPYNVLNFS